MATLPFIEIGHSCSSALAMKQGLLTRNRLNPSGRCTGLVGKGLIFRPLFLFSQNANLIPMNIFRLETGMFAVLNI